MKNGGFVTSTRLLLAALLAAPIAVGVSDVADRAEAALPGDVTPFEIDSNTVPTLAGGVDWTTQPNVAVSNDANYAGGATVPTAVAPPNPAWRPNCVSSTTDTVFKNSTNISDPVFDQFETQSVPDKTDICQSFFSYDVVQSGARAGHIVAYLGFTRRAFNGDGSFYFLLSRGADPDVRVAGDIGIQVDYDSQGDPDQLTVQEWAGAPVPSLGARTVVPVDDPNVQLSPVEYFAELAIDLTALDLAPNVYELPDAQACDAFGYGRIISRTGNSPSATLKDDGEPTELDFDVCGRIDVTKVVTAAVPGATTFPASLDTPDGVTVPGSAAFDLTVPGGALQSPTTTFGSVPPRLDDRYRVAETLTGALDTQWDLDDIECVNDNGTPGDPDDDRIESDAATFTVFTDEVVACTITNSPAPARVNVTKVVTPAGSGGDTEWTVDLTGRAPQPVAEGETISFTDLAPGSFTLTETDPANAPGQPPFDVVGWSCEDGAVTATGASIGIVLDPGAVYDCTVTNALVPVPVIEVVKTAQPTSFPEPAGSVTYSVSVTNTGTEPVTIDTLTDDVSLNAGAPSRLDLAQDAPGAAAGGTVVASTCDTAVVGRTIPGGGQVACTFTVDYAGRDAGDVVDDTVTASGTDSFGRPVSDADDAQVTVTDRLPVITVDKQNVEPTAVVAPGGPATYSVVVTNGPNAVEAITITSIADVLTLDGAAFGPANLDITTPGAIVTATSCGGLIGRTLQPGESTLPADCTFTIDTTQLGAVAQGDDLTNTATVTAVDDDGNDVSDADPASRDVLGAPPQMGVFKTDGGAVIDEPGEQVTYTVDIFNLGTTEALTITRITDEVRFNGVSIGTLTWGAGGALTDGLPAGTFVSSTCGGLIGDTLAAATGFEANGRPSNADATVQCTITLALAADAGDVHDDTVVVDAVDATGDPVSAENSADTPAQDTAPVIEIVKTANPTSVPETGGTVTFTFDITNASGATDPVVLTQLVDDRFGDLFDGPRDDTTCDDLEGDTLAPGASVSCTLTATLAGDVGIDHVNVVTVTGVDDEGTSDTDTDDAVVVFDDVLPTITVDKSANPTSVPEQGANVTYTVVVTNTSGEDVTITSLGDDRYGNLADPLNPALVDTTCSTGAVLAPGASFPCTFTAFVVQASGEPSHVNVVTGSAVDDEQNTATDDDDATVTFDLVPPTVDVTKTDDDAFVLEPGGTVTYTVEVTNTSFEAVTVTSLTDTITTEAPAQVLGPIDLFAPVAPVSNSTCLAAYQALGSVLAPAGQAGDSFTCSFDVALSGTAQLVRDTVAVAVVDDDLQPADDTADESTPIADVAPTVTIDKTADPTTVQSGGATTYRFVITNPSTFEDLTLLSFTDDTYPFTAGECDITGVVLPPLGTFECEIARTLVGDDGDQVTNVATVTAADDELLAELAEEGSTAVPVSDSDDAVVDVVAAELTRTKALTAEARRDASGLWTVEYTLEVANGGGGTGRYTLRDELRFGDGVVVQSVDVVATSTGQTTPPAPTAALADFDGGSGVNGGGTDVVVDADIVGGATHTYVVTVTATVPAPVAGAGACDPDGEEAGGFLNTAVLVADGVTGDPVSACDEFSTLTLVKEVVNDDGGPAAAEDVVLTATDADGTVVVEGAGRASAAVEAGEHALAETPLAGYVGSGFRCVGGEVTGATVDVPEGADVMCTVVNDDEPVDLELTKDDGGIVVDADRTTPFPYTIEVTNTGPRELDDEPVTVVDVLPPAFAWATPLPAGCTRAGRTLTCTLDPAALRPVGTTVTITAQAVLVPGAGAGTYQNRAWVTTADDPVCEGEGCTPPPCTDTAAVAANDNVDCEPTPVVAVVDIEALSPECVGDAPYIAYDLALAGVAFPGTATLTFFDRDGELVETRTVTSLQGRVIYPGAEVDADGNAVDWPGWRFENGLWVVDPTDAILREGLTVRVDVNPTATATVTYPPASSACDRPEQVSADLSIVKDASVTTAERGGTFNWVLTVTNRGPDPATNVVVSDTVPAPLLVTAAGSSALDCTTSGNRVTCTGASLAVGATATVVVTVATPTDAPAGTITNTGSVQATTPDPDLTNNADDASVVVPAAVVQPPAPPPAAVPPTPSARPLPRTGSDVATALRAAALLVAAGLVVVGVTRRRRRSAAS